MSKPSILKNEFENNLPYFEQQQNLLNEKINLLFSNHHKMIHSITSRIKNSNSLLQKLKRPDRDYNELEEVTDLIGFRIITYFEDHIEQIAKKIEDSLQPDLQLSSNRLNNADFDRFGYRSLHYICPIDSKQKKAFQFEIQIRTVVQHAWAEIEHDLGYKTSSETPLHLRRRLSQAASLLEIVDREFVNIRTEIENYETNINLQNLDKHQKIQLDQISLRKLMLHEYVQELDESLSQNLNLNLQSDLFFPEYILKALKASGMDTLESVIDEIKKHKTLIPKMAQCYFKFSKKNLNFDIENLESIQKGYSLLFIAHLRVLHEENLMLNKLQKLTEFYEKLDFENQKERAKNVAEQLLNSYWE